MKKNIGSIEGLQKRLTTGGYIIPSKGVRDLVFFPKFRDFLGIFWIFLDFFLKRVRDFFRVFLSLFFVTMQLKRTRTFFEIVNREKEVYFKSK